MDKEMSELKEENKMFFSQEDRVKLMLRENEKLKSENVLMKKEVSYADEKLR
jgi:FtsZ-binding cell division protein ZapB